MATLSKSEAGIFDSETNGFDNGESNDDVISIASEEVTDDNDNDVTISRKSLRSNSASNLITPSQKSLRKKAMLKSHNNSSLSIRSIISEDGQDDQEMYHFGERDDVINTDSAHSSHKELNLSTASFSNFGKYERTETANEDDLMTAQQFMFSLAKVRIYMN